MNANLYAIREERNVLFAQDISPYQAARKLTGKYEIFLATEDDLQSLAIQRKKLLHVLTMATRKNHGVYLASA
jgi:hypothetical protein